MRAIFTIFGIPISAYMVCLAGQAINKWYNDYQNKISAKKEAEKDNKVKIKQAFFSDSPIEAIDNSMKELMVAAKAMLQLKAGLSEGFTVKSVADNHYIPLNNNVGQYVIEMKSFPGNNGTGAIIIVNISIVSPNGRVMANKPLRKGSLNQIIHSLDISDYNNILFFRHSFGRLLE